LEIGKDGGFVEVEAVGDGREAGAVQCEAHGARHARLALEEVGHGLDGMNLEGLIGSKRNFILSSTDTEVQGWRFGISKRHIAQDDAVIPPKLEGLEGGILEFVVQGDQERLAFVLVFQHGKHGLSSRPREG